jgi:hypothetical protein
MAKDITQLVRDYVVANDASEAFDWECTQSPDPDADTVFITPRLDKAAHLHYEARLALDALREAAKDEAGQASARLAENELARLRAERDAALGRLQQAEESRNKAWAEKDAAVAREKAWEKRAQEAHHEIERRDAYEKRLRGALVLITQCKGTPLTYETAVNALAASLDGAKSQ